MAWRGLLRCGRSICCTGDGEGSSGKQKPALRFRDRPPEFSSCFQPFRDHDFRVGKGCICLPRRKEDDNTGTSIAAAGRAIIGSLTGMIGSGGRGGWGGEGRVGGGR